MWGHWTDDEMKGAEPQCCCSGSAGDWPAVIDINKNFVV